MLFPVLCQGLLDCTCTVNWSRGFFSASWTSFLSLIHRTPGAVLLKQVGKGVEACFGREQGWEQAARAAGIRILHCCRMLCVLCPGAQALGWERRAGKGRRGWMMPHTSTAVCLQSLHTSRIVVPRGANWSKVNPGLVCRQKHVHRRTNAHAVIARHGDAHLHFACCPCSTRSHTVSTAQGKWQTCPRWDILTLSNFSLSWEEISGAKGPTS